MIFRLHHFTPSLSWKKRKEREERKIRLRGKKGVDHLEAPLDFLLSTFLLGVASGESLLLVRLGLHLMI